MKYFNITGSCDPDENYMVDISDRVSAIGKMVEQGKYIVINRGRQYGKTTTLTLLEQYLSRDYMVFSISFEDMDSNMFRSADTLAYWFLNKLKFMHHFLVDADKNSEPDKIIEEYLIKGKENFELSLFDLSIAISRICIASEKPVVVMIDEVDKAGNYTSFLDFLGLLRSKYLERKKAPTFKSVILASVYNIKNLKLKLRPDSESQYNSPWNIAESFNADMSFSKDGIANMLKEYEKDYQTGMDIDEMSEFIYDYTSGYPFFVSKICKMLDESANLHWDRTGFLEVLKQLLMEENTMFDDMIKKLEAFPGMRQLFYDILYNGRSYPFVIDDADINIASMFGYIRNVNGLIQISNRIYETRLYNLFSFEESKGEQLYIEGSVEKNQFIKDGYLDMQHILERFVVQYTDIYGDRSEAFCEKEGRKFFMLYIRPIINGVGNYYIEAETRDETKTDMVVDYKGEQYVIEMKIWRGNAYNTRGEKQLAEYLDYFHVDKGYMLSFNFNKNKQVGTKIIEFDGKTIIEAVV